MNVNGIGANNLKTDWAGVKPARDSAVSAREPSPEKTSGESGTKAGTPAQEQTKAVFALDKDRKVVIRILDGKGDIIRQIPPEESGLVKKELAELMKNLFNREV